MNVEIDPTDPVTLHRASSDRLERVRGMSDAEARRIDAAIAFVRRYSQGDPFGLLVAAHEAFELTLKQLDNPSGGQLNPLLVRQINSALVSWILLWRFTIDNWKHDIERRFGKLSAECTGLIESLNSAYDSHPGYRVAEGMRNLVQHQEMPPLNVTRNHRRESDGNLRVESTLVVLASWFLDWRKCPAMLKRDLRAQTDKPVDIQVAVHDAMDGLTDVARKRAAIDGPELSSHLALLRSISAETAPGVPVLTVTQGDPGVGYNIRMTRLDDLIPLIYYSPGFSQRDWAVA